MPSESYDNASVWIDYPLREYEGRWFDSWFWRGVSDSQSAPLYREYNVRATFNLDSTLLGRWPVQHAARYGPPVAWPRLDRSHVVSRNTLSDYLGLTTSSQILPWDIEGRGVWMPQQRLEASGKYEEPWIAPAHRMGDMATFLVAPLDDFIDYETNGIPAVDERLRWIAHGSALVNSFGTPHLLDARYGHAPYYDTTWAPSFGSVQKSNVQFFNFGITTIVPFQWYMHYRYPAELQDEGDQEVIWEKHHERSAMIVLQQSRGSDWNGYAPIFDDNGFIFLEPMLVKPEINGNSRFVRHPSEPWRIVPAWTTTHGVDHIHNAKPKGGQLGYDFRDGRDHERIISTITYIYWNSDSSQRVEQFKAVPGVKVSETISSGGGGSFERLKEFVFPVAYINHNGMANEPSLPSQIRAYAEQGMSSYWYDGASPNNHTVELVGYRPKISYDPEVGLDVITVPPQSFKYILSFDIPWNSDVVFVEFELVDEDNWFEIAFFRGLRDFSTDQDIQDFVQEIVDEINAWDTDQVEATRLADFSQGTERFHIEIEFKPDYAANWGTPVEMWIHLDIDNDVDDPIDISDFFEATMTDGSTEIYEPKEPTKWAIVADARDEPDWAATIPIWDGSDFLGGEGVLSSNGPGNFSNHGISPEVGFDEDGWLPLVPGQWEPQWGGADIGVLPPGPWILCVRYKEIDPDTVISGGIEEYRGIIDELFATLDVFRFVVSQRPRNAPWSFLNADGTVVPGALPDYVFPGVKPD